MLELHFDGVSLLIFLVLGVAGSFSLVRLLSPEAEDQDDLDAGANGENVLGPRPW